MPPTTSSRLAHFHLPAGPLKILRNSNYLKYFAGQLVSMSGTWMQSVAQSYLVWKMTESGTWLGIVTFCGQLPAFVMSPLAGLVADKADRRSVLIIVQIIEMVQAFILTALVFTHSVHLWHIVALSVVLGIVNAFDMTTRHAFAVDMVGREDLSNAIALNSVLINIARIIGPSLAGMVLAVVGYGWCFALNGLSYLPVIWGLAAMRLARHRHEPTGKSMVREIVDGATYARGHVVIFRILILSVGICFVACPFMAIMPIFANRVLHGNESTMGWLLGVLGCGAVSSALLFSGGQDIQVVKRKLISDVIFWGLGLVTLGLSRNLWLSMAAMFTIGYFMMSVFPSMNNAIQQLVDDRMRGRVMSLYTMTFLGTVPLGSLLIGKLADVFSAPIAVTAAGLLTFLMGMALVIRNGVRAAARSRETLAL